MRELIISAEQYQIVSGRLGAKISLTVTGQGVVAPGSPEERQKALLKAFEAVELFKKVADHYQGKKIPEDEYFVNTLVKDFEIERDRVNVFREVFLQNLNYLNAFSVKKPATGEKIEGDSKQSNELPLSAVGGAEPGTRQYLDTCFVLMPFGDYYDSYYSELYTPAIRDAGFDPVRADGIFTTGTVIEQIWERIKKAKVLLAELTGKNPNVFYELGLAHAIGKPIILISGKLEDVPFDLRHVRIITYDVFQPKWGEKLSKDITAHLRSARDEPIQSVPRMFQLHSKDDHDAEKK